MSSAFPQQVDDLLPKVQALAERLGEAPSRNRVMSELHVGAPKAKALLAALAEVEVEPTGHPTGTGLHLVTDTDRIDGDEQPDGEVFESAEEMVTHLDTAVPWQGDVTSSDTTQSAQVTNGADPGAPAVRPVRRWPLILLAAGAFVAIWSGWVGLGEMTGFGIVHPLPGIADQFALNSAITLPIGVEAYAAYALRVWLARAGTRRAQRFARTSALGSLVLGMAGQVAYHLMLAAGITRAPWPITTFVSCLPVIVLGLGAGLTHLLHGEETQQ